MTGELSGCTVGESFPWSCGQALSYYVQVDAFFVATSIKQVRSKHIWQLGGKKLDHGRGSILVIWPGKKSPNACKVDIYLKKSRIFVIFRAEQESLLL